MKKQIFISTTRGYMQNWEQKHQKNKTIKTMLIKLKIVNYNMNASKKFPKYTRNWIPDKDASFSTSRYPYQEPSGLFKLNETIGPKSWHNTWQMMVPTYVKFVSFTTQKEGWEKKHEKTVLMK